MAFLGLRLPKRNRISDLLGRAGRAAVDVVSANTQADVQRRLAAGQPASYQAQQAQVAAQRAAQRPAINASQFGAPTAQRPQQPRMPSVPGADNRSLLSRVYDQVNPLDANRTFKQATPTVNKNLIQQAGQVGGQFARGSVGGLAKMANTAIAQAPQVVEAGRLIAADLTKNPEAAAAASRRIDESYKRFGSKGGILGAGTLYSAQEAQKGELKTGIKKIGGGTLQAQTEAAGLMLGGFAGKKFIADLGKVGIAQAAATQLPNIAKAGVANIAQGGITALNQGASAKDALKAAAISGITGTIGDIGLGTIGSGVFSGAKTLAAAKTTGALRQQLSVKPLNEGGYIQLPGGKREVVVRSPQTSPELAGEIQAGRISEDVNLINPKDIKRGGGVQGARPQQKVVDEYIGKIKRDEPIDPLIVSVDKRTGQVLLEDGQNRLAAMNTLGISDVPVIVKRDVLPKVTTRQPSGAALQAQLAKEPALSTQGGIRPYNDIQTGIERALNKGDMATAKSLASKLPADVRAGILPQANINQKAVYNPTTRKIEMAPAKPTVVQRLAAPFKEDLGAVGPGVGKLREQMQSQAAVPVTPEKVRGFTKSVKQSPEVSPELQKLATDKYTPITKKETLATTEKFLQGDTAKVQADVFNRVSSKTAPDAQLISDSIGLMKKLDAEGNHEIANTLQQQMSKKLTESGQTVWAASLLNNRTPEGVLYGARKALNTAGIEITPELETGLQAAVSKIKVTKGADKEMAIKELQRLVAQQIPSSFGEKVVTLWKAGLLTGLKTQTGNALSNISSIALKKSSDPVAAAIDAGLSLFTGQRTKTATIRGLGGGTVEGLQKAAKFMKTGLDERTAITNKFDVQLTNYGKSLPGRAAQNYTDFVFNLMGAADRPYYYASLRNNLNDIALAQVKNRGIKSSAKSQFIKDFVAKPPQNALQTAIDAAEKSIFANDTLLSNLATGVRQRSGKFRPVIETIMPFTRVPSAIVTRVFDYTPVGAIKTVGKQIATGKFDQRALAEGLAEAATGTGTIWLGYQLSQAGLMTGAYPTDRAEQELWRLEGKQPYSIKFGDKWNSLNYTSPFGQIMAIGNNMSDAKKQGESFGGQLSAGIAGGANAVINQSFLQGLQGGLEAVSDPKRYAQTFVKQQAGSIIPTLIGDIAKVGDQFQRQVNTPLEAIQAKIPGLAQQLPAKTNVFGQPMAQKAGPLEMMVNPLRPTAIPTQTDINNELRRLQDTGQGTLPDISKADFFGKDTKVDKPTIQKIKTELGPQIQTAWEKAIADPRYQSMTDEEKSKSLDKIKSDLTSVYKAQNAEKYAQKQPDTPLSRDQLLIAKGYEATVKLPGDTVETPKEKYEAAMEVYKQDKRLGRISKVDEVKKQKDLSKLRIGSTYSQDVVDLHGLSGTQVQALLESNPDLGGAFNEMIIYDQALADAGIISKPKFKDKDGNIYLPGTQETGAGGGRSRGISASQFIKTTKARAPARVKLRGAVAPIARVQPAIRLTRPKVTIKKSKV
jgi:hypothetical protein